MMKLSILLFTIVSILFHSMCIHLTLRDKMIRKQEQVLSLKHAMFYTMNEMNDGMDDEEVFDLFIDAFNKQINSFGDYTIHVYQLDKEKGFLDIEVIQDFSFIHGPSSSISSRYQMMKEHYIGG